MKSETLARRVWFQRLMHLSPTHPKRSPMPPSPRVAAALHALNKQDGSK